MRCETRRGCDATPMLFATGKRLMEVTEAQMGEFDDDGEIWVIPPERRKGIRCDRHRRSVGPKSCRCLVWREKCLVAVDCSAIRTDGQPGVLS
jgi:hypothetical protein